MPEEPDSNLSDNIVDPQGKVIGKASPELQNALGLGSQLHDGGNIQTMQFVRIPLSMAKGKILIDLSWVSIREDLVQEIIKTYKAKNNE